MKNKVLSLCLLVLVGLVVGAAVSDSMLDIVSIKAIDLSVTNLTAWSTSILRSSRIEDDAVRVKDRQGADMIRSSYQDCLWAGYGEWYLLVNQGGRTSIRPEPASGNVALWVYGDNDATADIQRWATWQSNVVAGVTREGAVYSSVFLINPGVGCRDLDPGQVYLFNSNAVLYLVACSPSGQRTTNRIGLCQ